MIRLPRQRTNTPVARPALNSTLVGDRPRVALVTPGAVDRFAVPQIVTHLVRRASKHVDFVVISQLLADDLREQVEWRRVRIPLWMPFRVRYPLFVVLASLALRRTGADLRHTFGSHPVVFQRIDLATVQFSHTAHYGYAPEQDYPLVRILATAFERWSYRPGHVRALAAPSLAAKREFERDFPGLKVVVLPNGVDTDRFRPDAEARHALRASEGITDDIVVAVFVGRAWHGKGVDIALKALARVRADGADVRLWVVGEKTNEAVALADQLALTDWVRFYGRRSDVERFLQGADVFLFPSLTETFGLACFEAAAAGLAIVATAVGAVEELLPGGETGLVVDRTCEAFAHALMRLASDQEMRARMGSAARERALAFSWERAAEELVNTYHELLDPPA